MGTLLSVACQFAAIPVLVHQLGAAGMGVMAFSWLMTAIATALEMGLAPALSGELARRRSEPGAPPADRRLVRAFETPCWAIAAGVAASLALGSAWIARHWLSPEASDQGMAQTVGLMGLVACLALPMSLYVNGLLGIERHRGANLTRIFSAAAQHGGGAVVVLWHPDPRAWLINAILAQAIGIGIGRALLMRALPRGRGIDWAALHARRLFAGGLGGIGLLSVLISNLDRLVVSALLPLKTFAAYSLAAMVGQGIRLLATPVFGVLYPRLTALMAAGDQPGATKLYLTASRWMAACFAPIVAVSVLAAQPLLEAWCRNEDLARQAAAAAGLLAAGSALNALLTVPYALQLAVRWTTPGLVSAFSSLVITSAVLFVCAPRFGVVGAAIAWPVANLIVLVVTVPMTHRQVLPGLSRTWHQTVMGPILATFAVAAVAAGTLPGLTTHVLGAVWLGLLCLSGSVLVAWFVGRDRGPLQSAEVHP